MPQPETIEEYAARVLAAQVAAGGRLPLTEDGFTSWPSFPFEGDLRLREVAPLADEDQRRFGEDPDDCWCSPATPEREGGEEWPVVWRDDHWHLKAAPPSGAPCILILEPLEHVDLPGLTPQRAAEYGQISIALTAAVEALPSVGRCHVGRWGDGGAHAHVWFIARPARMPQTRGTFMALWDDYLPPVPVEVRDANVAAVVERLVTAYGGRAL